ncbi:hypothetical protein J6590_005945 [Homalodisca vitripennis]|nr:hypothetical protein J6590_005945 [Homalodisca vitripennis]
MVGLSQDEGLIIASQIACGSEEPSHATVVGGIRNFEVAVRFKTTSFIEAAFCCHVRKALIGCAL